MVCMMPFGYASFIEIQQLSKTLTYKLTSVASSFVLLATLFFFLYSTSIIGMRAQVNYKNPRFMSMYGALLTEFECNTPALMYYAIFSWKRFGQIIATAIFITSPALQTLCIASLQTFFLLYVTVTRPFKSAYNNVLSFFSQLFPLLITIYATSFANSANDPLTAYSNGWGCILILTVYCMLYLVIALVAVVQSIVERHEKDTRFSYQSIMKIKVALIKLFTQQGVRDEMLAKADGVDYIYKGGSSLTVVTRTKSQMDLTTRKSEATLPMDWGSSMKVNRGQSNEMKVEDDDSEMETPAKLGRDIDNLLDSPTPPRDGALPSIFAHRPQLDARMMVTPTGGNFPKVPEGAAEVMAKF